MNKNRRFQGWPFDTKISFHVVSMFLCDFDCTPDYFEILSENQA